MTDIRETTPSTRVESTARVATGRIVGPDAVRGLALVSMFVAHFGPVAGPLKVFQLSEYLTSYLFVLLIGVGAELGRHSSSRWRSSQARGLTLIAVGLALTQLPTQIVVVLVWLGVMTLLATWLVELPWWALGVIALAAVVLEPVVMDGARTWSTTHAPEPLTSAFLDLTATNPDYRLAALLAPACTGILLVRLARTDGRRWLAGGVALVVAAALFALNLGGVLALDAYSGTRQEVAFDTLLALGVTAVVWNLAVPLSLLGRVLAAMGAMSLTIYTVQIIGDWALLRASDQGDDRWVVLLGAILGSAVLATVWMPVARLTGWRGPMEGPLDALARGRWPRP